MALKYTRRVERIEFGEDDFLEVHGLGVPAITSLVAAHRDTAEQIFGRFANRGEGSITAEEGGELFMQIVVTVPAIAAHVIALGADAENHIDEIKHLPADVQVAAIEKIAELTFAMSGGLKNFLETVHRISVATNRLVNEVKTLRR